MALTKGQLQHGTALHKRGGSAGVAVGGTSGSVGLVGRSRNGRDRREPYHMHMSLSDVHFLIRASDRSAAAYLRTERRSPCGNDWLLPLEILLARQACARRDADLEAEALRREQEEAAAQRAREQATRILEATLEAVLVDALSSSLEEWTAQVAYDLWVDQKAGLASEAALDFLLSSAMTHFGLMPTFESGGDGGGDGGLLVAWVAEVDRALQREAFEAYATAEREKKEKLQRVQIEEEEKAKNRAEAMAKSKALKGGITRQPN